MLFLTCLLIVYFQILCCQEIYEQHYEDFFCPEMEKLGMCWFLKWLLVHYVQEKSGPQIILDRNLKSRGILTKLHALDSEYIFERTAEFC